MSNFRSNLPFPGQHPSFQARELPVPAQGGHHPVLRQLRQRAVGQRPVGAVGADQAQPAHIPHQVRLTAYDRRAKPDEQDLSHLTKVFVLVVEEIRRGGWRPRAPSSGGVW